MPVEEAAADETAVQAEELIVESAAGQFVLKSLASSLGKTGMGNLVIVGKNYGMKGMTQ